MSESFLYHRFTLLRPAPDGPGTLVGAFVVGVPQREFEDQQNAHHTRDAGSVFQSMILPREWALIGRYLRTSLEPMPAIEGFTFGEDPELTRGRATFEGIGGKKFWIESRRRVPGW